MTTHFILLLLLGAAAREADATEVLKADVCVYGATPAGIVAAIAAKQEGCSVVLIEAKAYGPVPRFKMLMQKNCRFACGNAGRF